MSNNILHLDIDPISLRRYREKFTFTVPPSKSTTGIDISLYFKKETSEIKAVCLRTEVIKPDLHCQGASAALEHKALLKEGGKIISNNKIKQQIEKQAIATVTTTRPVEKEVEKKEVNTKKPEDKKIPAKKENNIAGNIIFSHTASYPYQRQKTFKQTETSSLFVTGYTRGKSVKNSLKPFRDAATALVPREPEKYNRHLDCDRKGAFDNKEKEGTPKTTKSVVRTCGPAKRNSANYLTKEQLEGARKRILQAAERPKKSAQKRIKVEPQARTSVTTTAENTKYRGKGTEKNPLVILGDPGELVRNFRVAGTKFEWEEVA